jgi:hypothetical protein
MGFDSAVPFTRRQAAAAGVTDAMLRRRRSYRPLLRGVYVGAHVELTLLEWLTAALLVAPAGSVISHVTALRWYGFELGATRPLHVSSRSKMLTRQPQLRSHRRQARIETRMVRGVPVTDPDRTLVDLAYDVSVPQLIQAIEWMLLQRLTTIDGLTSYALDHRLRGVRRVRAVMSFVRVGAESPMETLVRLMIRFAHLPEPELNVDIHDDDGLFLARGDLVYRRWKVLVEYDGWQHERDARQRQSDIGRRERLERAGWTVIVVTSHDLRAPRQIVQRVHLALRKQGSPAPAPTYSIMWQKWFPTTR